MKFKEFVAAVYARKSVILKKGDTLNIQEDKCKKLLKYQYGDEYDLSIVTYCDEKSGKNMDRIAMQRMIRDIKAGKIKAVCSYKLDRFGRNATDLLNFVELLKKYGVKLYCVDDKIEYDPTDESDFMTKFLIMFLSLMAEMERNNIKQRVIASKDALSRKGFWLGGKAPYGFNAIKVDNIGIIQDVDAKSLYILVENENEIKMIEFIYKKFVTGLYSLNQIASMCDELGYVPRKASMFDQHTIEGLLKNPIFVKATPEVYDWLIEQGYKAENISDKDMFDGIHGLISYGKTARDGNVTEHKGNEEVIIAVAPHQGVIDAEVWIKVQDLLRGNKLPKRVLTQHDNALLRGGIFRCSCCGGLMSIYNRESRKDKSIQYPHYRCENKRKRNGKLCAVNNISATELDDEIVRIIFKMKDKLGNYNKLIKKQLISLKSEHVSGSIIPSLEAAIKKEEKAIKNIVQNMGSGLLDAEVITVLNDEIRARRDAIQELRQQIEDEKNAIDALNSRQKDLDEIANTLMNLTEDEFRSLDMPIKMRLISQIIEKVEWDGKDVHVFFKVPDEVCGGDTTDLLFYSQTALTNVDTVKQHF